MKSVFPFFFIAAFTLLSCKGDLPGDPLPSESFAIRSIIVNPTELNFQPADGVRDTIVAIQISAQVATSGGSTLDNFTESLNAPGKKFVYSLFRKGEAQPRYNNTFSVDAENLTIQAEIPFNTQTYDFNDYLLYVYAKSDEVLISNTALATIKVRGFSVGAPEIIFVDNPDTVRIPTTGTQQFLLSAKVVQQINQDLIDRVLVSISDQNGTVLGGSPFRLYDDGSAVNVGTGPSGDLVAGDSIYTRRFEIGPTNSPDRYTLRYFALDNFGNSSDTLQSTMVIAH